jgi:hypothetical protein
MSQSEQDPNERRLAGAVRAEVPEGAASRNAKVHAVDGVAVSEPFGQTASLYRQVVVYWLGGLEDRTAH